MRHRSPVASVHSVALRADGTSFEHVFWERVRDRRLAGLKFRRQHPVGPYVLDFYCPALRLAVELDGSQHAEHEAADRARDAWLATRGIVVLRFWNNEIMGNLDGVIDQILARVPP